MGFTSEINPLNAELNPICHLLALLGARHIFHVSGLRVNKESFSGQKYPIERYINAQACVCVSIGWGVNRIIYSMHKLFCITEG